MVKRDRRGTKSKYGTVRVDRILTLPIHDQLDENVVSSIAESFPLSGGGPINPITVRRVGAKQDGVKVKTVLVAGAHRLAAARCSGMKRIDCTFFEGDENDARIVQIEEDLFRKHLTVLQHAELLAEWAELALAKGYISGQRVRKKKSGRPQSGFSKSARKLPVVGRSFEARRKMITRATKIARISSEAKDVAKARGLDDNQKALLKIAKAGKRKAQVKKAEELGDRLRKAIKVSGVDADLSSSIVVGVNRKRETIGAVESLPPQPDSDSKAKGAADASHSNDENASTISRDTTLDELEAVWKQAGAHKLWKHAPVPVREEFVDTLLRARCAATADVVSFLQDVFRGRKQIYARELYCFATTKGIQKRALREHLRGSPYRRKKRGSGAGAPWAYLNDDRDWKEHLKIISDDDLRAPFAAECKREVELSKNIAPDPADYDYYKSGT
jgi:ParB-like chromosome segregation protein Spo0J